LFLCFFSLFSPSPVSLLSLSPTHFQKVQACVRAGMKLDNTISVHNLKYDGVHDNIHRLRWVPEHSGIGKSALSSRSLSTVYRQRIQSLSKSVLFFSFLFFSFLFFSFFDTLVISYSHVLSLSFFFFLFFFFSTLQDGLQRLQRESWSDRECLRDAAAAAAAAAGLEKCRRPLCLWR